MKVIIISCIVIFAIRSNSIAQEASINIKLLQPKIDSVVEAGRNELHLPGVSLAIMQGHKIIFSRGYGFADLQAKIPATEYTIYPIASISKHFTAAAIMKLVDQGRLRLDEPVSKYLPSYLANQKPVLTIRHLLHQTSGIIAWDDLPQTQGIDTGRAADFTLQKIVELIGQQSHLYPAGYWWSYSNSNYSLLAAIIEKITGKSYEQYLREIFFNPLHLSSTGSCEIENNFSAGSKATGYLAVVDSFILKPFSNAKAAAFTGASGLCSNVIDVVHWMRALVDGKAVSASSFKKMITSNPVEAGFIPPYGFGLSLRSLVGEPAIWHKGSMAGYNSMLAYFPKQDIMIASITNSRRVPLETMVMKVARTLMSIPEPVLQDLPVPDKEAKLLIGNYNDGMFKISIVADSGKLFMNISNLGGPFRLFYQGNGEFATHEPRLIRLRMVRSHNNIDRLEWEWGELRAYGWREK